MPTRRSMRVSQLIRQDLGSLLARLADPRLIQASITEVEMSSDLRRAFVYYSCPRNDRETMQTGFDKAAGFIKRQLAPQLQLKYMPDLVFRHDPSIDAGEDMDMLLSSLDKNDQPTEDQQ